MATPDFYEARLRWPHSDANTVIVTGEFDNWSGSRHLSRTSNGFEGIVQIPWGRKTAYKYIVDGRWITTDDQPTEMDSIGNLNNVYSAPARPAQATPAPEQATKPEVSSPPVTAIGTINGFLSNAKSAAVAMVEAMAPGTTQTPQPTPAIGTDSMKEKVLGAAATVKEEVAESEPEAKPTEAAVPTPKEEITVEAVLPVPAEVASTAPVVPVPVLPLTESAEAPTTNGHAEKALKTEVVEGAATSETKPEPPTSAPVAVGSETPTVATVEPSTHTPAVNGSVPSAEPAPSTEASGPTPHDGPSTHSPVVLPTRKSESSSPTPITNGVNGNHTEKPTEIALPAPTPSEVPLPTTPAANGKPAQTPSATSSPASSPRKEKRSAFSTFGRHHRQSSSTSVSTSGTADEHGVLESPSRKGTMKKKRTSSIFSKVKTLFSDDHKKEKESP